jgi:hypothetical protein
MTVQAETPEPPVFGKETPRHRHSGSVVSARIQTGFGLLIFWARLFHGGRLCLLRDAVPKERRDVRPMFV